MGDERESQESGAAMGDAEDIRKAEEVESLFRDEWVVMYSSMFMGFRHKAGPARSLLAGNVYTFSAALGLCENLSSYHTKYYPVLYSPSVHGPRVYVV